MGITIQGIITLEKEKSAITKIEKAFRASNIKYTYDIELLEEPIFEELIERKRQDDIIDVYTDNKGTLITFSHNILENFSTNSISKYFDFDYFDLDDTSMAYRFSQFKEGGEKLSMNIFHGMNIIKNDDSREILGDNFLDIKDNEDIYFVTFHKLVDSYLTTPLDSIDLSQKVNRYKVTKREKLNKFNIKEILRKIKRN
ncbi:hypothetical protein F7646_13175 [Tenacibaculum finnmarkense genomovar finnmarkense]|uniref:hypothetical protein n=1 Tax=Tenacibaculum finnmarkense TaxID=2781243 RepID=UPI00187B1487|nr:hypothetical protein [Tenacibaculum finnmarkense]MBE7661524.1 hypothetical protein [Tenacibaculum finnmarkense genomovar finnmarkense]